MTRNELAKIIWETSRADESTISAMGANIVADAILASGFLAKAWEEGRCAAARGVRSNPYVGDNPSKDGED